MLVVGENGAGKTNLLEALHLGTQGFSPRTRADRDLIRFGDDAAQVQLAGTRAGTPLELAVLLAAGQPKRAAVNGARLATAEQLRRSVQTLVFTPDRLAVVKSGPAARRAYFDRALGRLQPARAALPAEYGAAIAQRNAALRRVSLGLSDRAAVAPWTEQVASLGAALVAARTAVLDRLAPGFRERLAELGLAGGRLRYEAEPPTVAALEARLARDLDRGSTGLGPHLDDVGVEADGRDLRGFGSQGEQRLAVLALLLAEAELLAAEGPPPLLLLDDVLSELDPGRRRTLAARIRLMGQTVITTTSPASLPAEPDQLVEVSAGAAGSEVDPLGPEVRRELGRFGPSAGIGELVAAWPAAVGPEIARNAWPARIARDGTVHVHTTDAIWAFELGQRAAEIGARLGVDRLRFAPGPLPAPADPPERVRPASAVEPSPEDAARAEAIAATVEDEQLRRLVARAAALSLARARSGRPI